MKYWNFFVIIRTIVYILTICERFFRLATNWSFYHKRKNCSTFFFRNLRSRTYKERSFWHIISHKTFIETISLNKRHFFTFCRIFKTKSIHKIFKSLLVFLCICMFLYQCSCGFISTSLNKLGFDFK